MFDINSTFFTSDYHLYHSAIIKYTDRPVRNVNEMHQLLKSKNNESVEKKDIVWNIGDVCIKSPEFVGKIRKQLDQFNGIKHLVIGNHDEWKTKSYSNAGFLTTHSAMWFKYGKFTFYLMHDPAEYAVIEDDPKAILLCGHVHKLFKHLLPEKRVINVGVDVWGFAPVSFKQIINLLEEYKIL